MKKRAAWPHKLSNKIFEIACLLALALGLYALVSIFQTLCIKGWPALHWQTLWLSTCLLYTSPSPRDS